MDELQTVLAALSTLRAPKARDEYDLHAQTAQALAAARLSFRHEAPVAPRRRVDFLCGSVAIEVKRGRPARAALLTQLAAYARSPLVSSVVLVTETVPSPNSGFVVKCAQEKSVQFALSAIIASRGSSVRLL